MVQKVIRTHQRAGYDIPEEPKLQALRSEVSKMLQNGSLTQMDLTRMEQKLRQSTCPPIVRRGSKGGAGQPSRANPLAFTLPTSIGTTKNTRPAQSPKDDPWTQLAVRELQAYDERHKADQARAKALQLQQKTALDDQVKSRAKLREAVVQQSKVYVEQEVEQRKKWEAEQEVLENKFKERYQAEKAIRDSQLLENRKRRIAEVEARRKEDELIAQRIREDLELEKQIEQEKKQKAKSDVARFLAYNQKQKALMASHAQAEFEADKKHQAEFLASLEKQELQRDLALKTMFSRQSKQADMAAALQKTIEEQALVDEQKAKTEQERLRIKAEKEEALRLAKARQDKERLRTHLGEQLKIKEQQREEQRVQSDLLKAQLAQAAKEAEQKELKQRGLRKELDLQYREKLKQQIRDRQAITYEEMTEVERKLNRSLLAASVSLGSTK